VNALAVVGVPVPKADIHHIIRSSKVVMQQLQRAGVLEASTGGGRQGMSSAGLCRVMNNSCMMAEGQRNALH
jgi:hypothetical protein